MTKLVYLAGPEVFLRNASDIGARKRAICESHGLVGVFPTDETPRNDPTLPVTERGLAISRAMEAAMRRCDAIIVNLTPFRGPSADVGTAYETGFMRALDRPVFAYSNDTRLYAERIAAIYGAKTRPTGDIEDAEGMEIESFNLHDNLMLAGGIVGSGGTFIVGAVPVTERHSSLVVFEQCVARAAAHLIVSPL